jgi:hypothetical protein
MSRRTRREKRARRLVIDLAASTAIDTVKAATALAAGEFVAGVVHVARSAMSAARASRQRKASTRTRRARVAKRIAARRGAQHFPRKVRA